MCAMCKASLTARQRNGDPEAIIGDECHIAAQSSVGPRGGDPEPGTDIDSYANVILLCATDHRLIDAQPLTFNAPYLRRLKAEHEIWVAERLLPEEAEEALRRSGVTEGEEQARVLEGNLRRHGALRYGRLTVPDLTAYAHVAIDDLYVPTPVVLDDEPPPTLYDRLIPSTFRVVILGHPGAGKSTLAQKICFDLCADRTALQNGSRPVGLLVQLRRIGGEMSNRSAPMQALLDAIERVIDSELQLPVDRPALERMLAAGRLVPVFDGLDELPTPHDRRAVRDGLEQFAERYPEAPIIVTARITGYDHARLGSLRFRHGRITDLEEPQIRAYAERWFRLTSPDRDQADLLAAAFLSESSTVADLRRSPLMLSLLCALYRGDGFLERSRAGVYERAALLLFTQWDRLRGVEAPRLQPWFRSALRLIAWELLTTLAEGIGRERAVELIVDHFEVTQHEGRATAAADAEALLEFCVGRSWVFTEFGVTSGGTAIFQFTHRTFLEYFAAEHIVVDRPSDRRACDMLDRLRAGDEMVPTLCVHLLDQRYEGGATRIMNELRELASGADGRARIDALARRVADRLPPGQTPPQPL